MNALKRIFFIVSLLISESLFCQNSDTIYVPKSSLKFSYLGSIIHPGLRAGIELPLFVKYIYKQKKNRVKTILKSKSLDFNLGFYHQKDLHDNLFLTCEWQMRRQNQKGWFRDFEAGLGFSRAFVGGTTYSVSDNGEVSIKKFGGNNFALVSLAYGFGYDFYYLKEVPVKVFSKISLLTLFPYNSIFYVRPTIELGIIYSLSGFVKMNPKIKTKQR